MAFIRRPSAGNPKPNGELPLIVRLGGERTISASALRLVERRVRGCNQRLRR